MSGVLPKEGTGVKTKPDVIPDFKMLGTFVAPKYIGNRVASTEGIYRGWVPGCGGDVWFVEHEDGKIAAYMYDEVTIMSDKSNER